MILGGVRYKCPHDKILYSSCTAIINVQRTHVRRECERLKYNNLTRISATIACAAAVSFVRVWNVRLVCVVVEQYGVRGVHCVGV